MVRHIRPPLHCNRSDNSIHGRRQHGIDPRALQIRRHPRLPPQDLAHAQLCREACEAFLREDLAHGDVGQVLQALQRRVGEGFALVVGIGGGLGRGGEGGVEEGEG
jgi:hypothetical protein